MPSVYQRLGLSFEYPDNWAVEEDDPSDEYRTVTVYCPDGGAFWAVTCQPAHESPAWVAAEAVRAMREAYEDLDSEDVTEVLEETELIGADLNFYCLDLTNSAQIRVFKKPIGVLMVLSQAEDREFPHLLPVFRAMTTSLMRAE